jgi:hypothetical protein
MAYMPRRLAAVLAALSLLLLPGCGGQGAPAPSFSITRVGWYEENIDPTFWASPHPSGQAAFYDFFIHYEGDVAFGDLQSVRIIAPDGHFWDILRDETFLDTTAKVIGGWRRWYGGPAPNLLPLGDMRARVTLVDGRVFEATRTIPAPGSTTAVTSGTMHTEDVAAPPVGSAPMVRRVSMWPGATLDVGAQTLSLAFSTTDPLAHGGWVWVYDAAGAFLGGSVPFRDPFTEVVAPQLGGQFRTDGSANALVLQAADLRLVAGATFSQIDRVRVVVTDGAQHAALKIGAYDCRSVGPAATLTRP